ncbi:MAG: amidohydrolase family protein [bacterium]
MNYENLNIRSIPDLAKLPWFESDERGIRLRRDAGIPPVIDTHTHLGFCYGFSARIDLKAKTPSVEYFFDYSLPQDILNNRHVSSPETAAAVDREMWWIMLKRPPRAKTHTLPNLIDEMDRCGITRAVALPVEIPYWPRHSRHTLKTCRGQDRVIPFASVHPLAPNPRERLAWFMSQGCKGTKYHPEFQFHPPDSPQALRFFGYCEEMGVVVLSHSGNTGAEPAWIQKLSALSRFRVIFKRFPKLKFILGHAGIRSLDEAIAYSREFPNVYLETSGQPVPALRKIFKETDSDKVMFGSDWAFYPIAVCLAHALVSTEGRPELREKYLHGNATRLLGIELDCNTKYS